jgi:hypothetical protein
MTAPVFDPTDSGSLARFNAANAVLNEYLWIVRWMKVLTDDPANLNLKALAQLPHHCAELERLVPGDLDEGVAVALSALMAARFGQEWKAEEIPDDLAAARDDGKALRAVIEEKMPTIVSHEIVWDTVTRQPVEQVRTAAKADHPEVVAALTKNRASLGGR